MSRSKFGFDSLVQRNKKVARAVWVHLMQIIAVSASIRYRTDAKMIPPSNSAISTKSQSPSGQEKFYRIGELAREFGITLRTLRFYEDRGLIQPARVGKTRYYRENDRDQLRICLLCKQSGMALADIKQVLELNVAINDGKDRRSELQQIYLTRHSALRKQQALTRLAIAELRNEIDRLRPNPHL